MAEFENGPGAEKPGFAERLAARFGKIVDEAAAIGEDIVSEGLASAGKASEILKEARKKAEVVVEQGEAFGRAVYEQSKRTPEIKEAFAASELAYEMLTSNAVTVTQVYEISDGRPCTEQVEAVESLDVVKGGEDYRLAIGTMGGKKYIMYAEPKPLEIRRGEAGYDSIEDYSGVLVGRNGNELSLIEPEFGGKGPTINIKGT